MGLGYAIKSDVDRYSLLRADDDDDEGDDVEYVWDAMVWQWVKTIHEGKESAIRTRLKAGYNNVLKRYLTSSVCPFFFLLCYTCVNLFIPSSPRTIT